MKLLLTSGGVTNKTLKRELLSMIDKPFSESVALYVPTATLTDKGPHEWIDIAMKRFTDLGWKEFHYMDFNSLPKDYMHELLNMADVVYVEGGNVYGLEQAVIAHDLSDIFERIFSEKVYVGVSAGSMLFSKHASSATASLFDEENDLYADSVEAPFGLFDWYLKPHLNSPYFSERTDVWADQLAEKVNFPLYVITDEDAVKVIDDEVAVVGEGKWKYYEEVATSNTSLAPRAS